MNFLRRMHARFNIELFFSIVTGCNAVNIAASGAPYLAAFCGWISGLLFMQWFFDIPRAAATMRYLAIQVEQERKVTAQLRQQLAEIDAKIANIVGRE